MTDPAAPTVGEHLADRYGRRATGRRPLVIAVVGAAALIGLGWLLWVAIVHANPPVSSRLLSFRVESATVVQATIEVQRGEQVEAVCQIQAKAADFSIVGESTVVVAAGPRHQVLRVTIRTQRPATAAVLIGCTTAGSARSS